MKPTLLITNTMTGKKEVFEPAASTIKMYVCGITPYDYAHVGHGRCYVTFDTLYRVLEELGYSVTYCRNFTDVDDRLISRAVKELGDPLLYPAIATKFIQAFMQDMQALACISPTIEPRVTEHIPEIVAFVQGLVDAGKAYVSDGDVYFSIEMFPEYGKLSKRNLDELMAGARVAVSEKKKNPLDFALWKREEPGTFWQSPWGWGRPGWHIECSALAQRYLGTTLDIHGGGMDLIFPHHENEIAQSESLHLKPLARHWVHNAFVRIDQEKMSKSLGNFFTLRQIFEQFDPMLVRYLFINHHYRSPLDFSFDDFEMHRKSYQRIVRLLQDVHPAQKLLPGHTIAQKMLAFICDDLNTPGMLGVLFENFATLQENEQERAGVKYVLTKVLGLSLQPLPEKQVTMTPEIEELIAEREKARAAKNWARADELRTRLKELGYEVQDRKKQ